MKQILNGRLSDACVIVRLHARECFYPCTCVYARACACVRACVRACVHGSVISVKKCKHKLACKFSGP